MNKSEVKISLDMHCFGLIFYLFEFVDLKFYNKAYTLRIENSIKCPSSHNFVDNKDIEIVVLKWLGRAILECHTQNIIGYLHSSSNSVCF